MSSIQEQDSKHFADKSKIEQLYVTVEKPNDKFDESRSVKQKVFKSD